MCSDYQFCGSGISADPSQSDKNTVFKRCSCDLTGTASYRGRIAAYVCNTGVVQVLCDVSDVDVTGDTANEPMVIGGGTYAKSLKNIIAFGPEKLGIDYHIHGADEYILVSGMEEAVLVYMEAIKNLLAI